MDCSKRGRLESALYDALVKGRDRKEESRRDNCGCPHLAGSIQ
jgi:hypothetical protein